MAGMTLAGMCGAHGWAALGHGEAAWIMLSLGLCQGAMPRCMAGLQGVTGQSHADQEYLLCINDIAGALWPIRKARKVY